MTKFPKVDMEAQGLFFKDTRANSDFLYIQNNIQWFFTKVSCQEAQVGPIYIE